MKIEHTADDKGREHQPRDDVYGQNSKSDIIHRLICKDLSETTHTLLSLPESCAILDALIEGNELTTASGLNQIFTALGDDISFQTIQSLRLIVEAVHKGPEGDYDAHWIIIHGLPDLVGVIDYTSKNLNSLVEIVTSLEDTSNSKGKVRELIRDGFKEITEKTGHSVTENEMTFILNFATRNPDVEEIIASFPLS